MGPWLDAFVATFGMIALGAVLRRKLLPDVAIWAGMEKLVFTILLPALLVSSIGAVDLARLPLGSLAATIWGTLLIGTALSFALARALRHGHATTTSILQGGIRYNNLLAFAVAGAVHGAPGIAFGGIATGLIVPCVQVIITIAFALGGQTRPDPLRVLKQIATNPLILACAAGLLLALLGGPPPGAERAAARAGPGLARGRAALRRRGADAGRHAGAAADPGADRRAEAVRHARHRRAAGAAAGAGAAGRLHRHPVHGAAHRLHRLCPGPRHGRRRAADGRDDHHPACRRHADPADLGLAAGALRPDAA
ncbi:AEC family transporter [Teichococcus cervicalis]